MDANRKLGISLLALFVAMLLPAELRAAHDPCPAGAITRQLQPASWEVRRGMVRTELLLCSDGVGAATLPGPEIRVNAGATGATVKFCIVNLHNVEHTFDIPGLASVAVPALDERGLDVPIDVPGSFYYTGATPEERDRGMYGAFIVLSANERPIAPEFDYVHFYDEIARDPSDAITTTPADPTHMKPTNFTHEFILNGSTIDATVAGENLDANIIHGVIGEMLVIRTFSVGSETHAPHGHGHLFQATVDGLTTDGLTPAGPALTIPTDVPRMPSGVVRNLYMLPRSVGVWPLHCHQETHLLNGVEAEYPGGEFTHVEFTSSP